MPEIDCPICFISSNYEEEGLFVKFYCKLCGRFSLETNVYHTLQDINKFSPVIFANLRGWLTEHQEEKIDSELFETLLKLRTPSVHEKSQKLLAWLSDQTEFPGESVALNLEDEKDYKVIHTCWASNYKEVRFLAEYLVRKEYVRDNGVILKSIFITHEGYAYLEEIKKDTDSNLGFCAMWFDKSLDQAWHSAIELAIQEAGYEPKRVDKHPHNDGVVDEIVALIRRSKFVISDLTGHRNGVYYEAGFAKGLGREVIFTCRKDEEKELHFDIRHYNVLFWEANNYNKFKEDLRWRIESTLGRGSVSED